MESKEEEASFVRLTGGWMGWFLCLIGFHEWHPNRVGNNICGQLFCCRKNCRAMKMFGRITYREKLFR